MAMSNARKILSGFIGGLTLTAVGAAASFIQFSLLVRHLPLEIAGTWMLFVSMGAYVMFFDLGMSATLGREISLAAGDPALTDSEKAHRIGTLIRSCTSIVAFLGLLVFLLGISGGWRYVASVIPTSLSAQGHLAWCIFSGGAALNLIGEGWFAGIYGLGQVFSEKIVRSLSIVVGVIFLSIAILTRSFTGLAVAYLLQACCTILMARYVLLRTWPWSIARGAFEFSAVRKTLVPSLKYAATLLGGILILQTDNLVIASTLGPNVIPDYQAVAKMISIMMQLSMMLVMTSLPIVSQAYARNDTPHFLRLMNRNLRYSLSIMTILATFVACFVDRVILAWLGPNHFVGFAVVWVLLAVMLLEVHHQSMASATMATGKLVFVAPALISGVLNIVFSVLLARRYGLLGVVLGTLFAQVTTNNWYAPWYTLRHFKIRFSDHVAKILVPILWLFILVLGANSVVRLLTASLSSLTSALAGVACTGTIGPACFFLIVMTADERGKVFEELRTMRM